VQLTVLGLTESYALQFSGRCKYRRKLVIPITTRVESSKVWIRVKNGRTWICGWIRYADELDKDELDLHQLDLDEFWIHWILETEKHSFGSTKCISEMIYVNFINDALAAEYICTVYSLNTCVHHSPYPLLSPSE